MGVANHLAELEQGMTTKPQEVKEGSLAKDITAMQLKTAARVARLTEEVIKVAAVIEVRFLSLSSGIGLLPGV